MAQEAWQHVDWKDLMKQHTMILEQHVSTIGQILDALRRSMDAMGGEEKVRWENGEVGNWGDACRMLDRARDTLRSAREAAELSGMLSELEPGDEKGVGVKSMGGIKTRGVDGSHEPDEVPEDSEMEDAPPLFDDLTTPLEGSAHIKSQAMARKVQRSQSEEKPTTSKASKRPLIGESASDVLRAEAQQVFEEPRTGVKRKKSDDDASKLSKKMKAVNVAMTAHSKQSPQDSEEAIAKIIAKLKMNKKRKRSPDGLNKEVEVKKIKSRTSTELIRVEDAGSTVDFETLQAKLQAEVDLGEAARDVEAQRTNGETKRTKKRRRSSDGLGKQGKKSKKDRI
ncbi:hypothetical protein BJ875DRAFT_459610 [Amylocarpus encephaloides]|uniref:Uncharacterized protein n=1 Tax=Amylocarpus encephaloides TaxID=45428 RepID=A0A9P7YJU8_9HELO|nr:hypothetical protein BJ875DRAFT_459610 [Amylocarpus encephaloides]